MLKRVTVCLSAILLISCEESNLKKEPFKYIRIIKAIEHPALNSVEKGIVDSMNLKNIKISIESAQGNVSIASQIANKFVNQKTDLVISIGTMPAQCFLKYTNDDKTKMIFSSVTDPKSANLEGQKNVYGVSNFVDIEQQIKIFKEIQPNLKTLGILYNPGEINSVTIVNKLKIVCEKNNISLLTCTVQKTSEISQASVKIVKNVDAVFISNDNTVLSSLKNVIKVFNEYKKPVYVSDTDAVEQGCLCAVGPNQYKIGVQTGKMANKILAGENVFEIEYPKDVDLYINFDVAKNLNIEVPKNLIKKASKIIGGNLK